MWNDSSRVEEVRCWCLWSSVLRNPRSRSGRRARLNSSSTHETRDVVIVGAGTAGRLLRSMPPRGDRSPVIEARRRGAGGTSSKIENFSAFRRHLRKLRWTGPPRPEVGAEGAVRRSASVELQERRTSKLRTGDCVRARRVIASVRGQEPIFRRVRRFRRGGVFTPHLSRGPAVRRQHVAIVEAGTRWASKRSFVRDRCKVECWCAARGLAASMSRTASRSEDSPNVVCVRARRSRRLRIGPDERIRWRRGDTARRRPTDPSFVMIPVRPEQRGSMGVCPGQKKTRHDRKDLQPDQLQEARADTRPP